VLQHRQNVTQKGDYLRSGYEFGPGMNVSPREQMKRAKKTHHTSANEDFLTFADVIMV